jgi:hypothetical protein
MSIRGALVMISFVLEVKTDGKLEIKLDSTALMRSLKSIENLDVNLRAVESAITWVLLPGLSEFVEGLSKGSLGLIPHSIITKLVSRSCGEIEFELKTENTIDVIKEVKDTKDFSHDLGGHAEDVGVILLESAHTSETRESTSDLISVEDTEVSVSDWQLFIGADSVIEHETMAGAIHGLHTETLGLNLEQVDVIFVVFVVTRGLPELQVEHVGGDDLIVASHSVLSPDQLDELVVDLGTVGGPKPAARRQHVMREQVLLFANKTMISLGGLLNQRYVVVHLLLRGEGDTINTLQAVVGSLT